MQSRKTKNVQISFDGLYANNLQNLCNPFSYAQNSEKLKKYQNLTTESGSKQRISFLQEKLVTQVVCL